MGRAACLLLSLCIALPALAEPHDASLGLNAAQVVEKNVAARGGLEAWKKIQTMVWVGHIESANAEVPSLPFALEMKRPNKTRFEIRIKEQTSARMYDGKQGWKLRPNPGGYPELVPYTTEELNFARDGQGFDGPLMDYQAKGVTVTLEGVDDIEGHKCYRLNVRLPSGSSHHVWVDATTFLDVRLDREARNAAGMANTVSVYYGNYQVLDGLKMPFLLESRADNGKSSDKMVIDRILLNPPLEDQLFAAPRDLQPGSGALRNRVNAPRGPRPPTQWQRRASAGTLSATPHAQR
ncbi:MAG: hypothetical protein ACM3KD_05040 [Hyphomicrobiaceae bacterium]